MLGPALLRARFAAVLAWRLGAGPRRRQLALGRQLRLERSLRGERALGGGELAEPAPLARNLDVGFELPPELLDHRADRHRHGVAQHAKAVADDVLLDG